MKFPADFEIIQPNDTAVEMQTFTIGETALFAYVPRYTDCHALDTYLFGVADGTVFRVTLQIEPGVSWERIDQHPRHPLQVVDDELVVIGGYGAGQEFVTIYHFAFDAMEHAMILQQKEQVKPDELKGWVKGSRFAKDP